MMQKVVLFVGLLVLVVLLSGCFKPAIEAQPPQMSPNVPVPSGKDAKLFLFELLDTFNENEKMLLTYNIQYEQGQTIQPLLSLWRQTYILENYVPGTEIGKLTMQIGKLNDNFFVKIGEISTYAFGENEILCGLDSKTNEIRCIWDTLDRIDIYLNSMKKESYRDLNVVYIGQKNIMDRPCQEFGVEIQNPTVSDMFSAGFYEESEKNAVKMFLCIDSELGYLAELDWSKHLQSKLSKKLETTLRTKRVIKSFSKNISKADFKLPVPFVIRGYICGSHSTGFSYEEEKSKQGKGGIWLRIIPDEAKKELTLKLNFYTYNKEKILEKEAQAKDLALGEIKDIAVSFSKEDIGKPIGNLVVCTAEYCSKEMPCSTTLP